MAVSIRHRQRFGRRNGTGGAGSPQAWDDDHEIVGQWPLEEVTGLPEALGEQSLASAQAREDAIAAALANKATTPDAIAATNDSRFLTSRTGKDSVLEHARNALLYGMFPIPGYIARPIIEKLGDWVNGKDFAACDGVTDDAAGLEKALSLGQVVDLPVGTICLKNAIAVRNGQALIGKGRTKTIIKVDGDFNMSALGVLRMQAGEPGAMISGIGITAVQPTAPASRDDLIQYPPAIYAQGCPRFRIEGVRISKFNIGVDARLNCGGASIDDLEIGCYGTDVWFDGSLDSVRLTRLHHWPFDGMTATEHRAIYSDSEHYGLRIGRVDDLHIAQWIGFSIPKAMYFYSGTVPGAAGAAFGHVVGADFDDRGGLVFEGSGPRITFSGAIFTMGKTDSQFINQAGGWALFTNCRFEGPPAASPLHMIELSGGASMFSNCNFNCSAQDLPLFKRTGAGNLDVVLSGCVIAMSSVLSQAFTTPILDLGDARGMLDGVHILGAKAGSGARDLLNSTRNDLGLGLGLINLNGWGFGTASQASKQIRTIGASTVTSGGTVAGTSEAASTAAAAGRGVFRFATGTGNQTDDSLIIGLEDAVAAWFQAIKPGSGFRSLMLQPAGGSVTVGPLTGPVVGDGGANTTLAIGGRTSSGRLELSSGGADAEAAVMGDINFADKNSSLTDKRRTIIRGRLAGTTANARGGALEFLVAADSGTVFPRALLLTASSAILGVANGTLGFNGAAGTTKPTITGSRADGSALADLLTKLAALGLITDGSSS